MNLLCKTLSLLVLTIVLLSSARVASARVLLGISYSEEPSVAKTNEAPLASQMEEAFGNLVTIYNYNDNKTLINMLTRFNKLDAALITRQTYNKHNSASLIALAEVQVSGKKEEANLVLTTHSYMSKSEQDQLMEGYQELILSTEGLELLEKYAKQHTFINQSGATEAPQGVIVKERENIASEDNLSAPTAPPTSDPPRDKQLAIPVEIMGFSAPATVQQPEALIVSQASPTVAEQPLIAETETKQPVANKLATMPIEEDRIPAKSTKKHWTPHADIKGKLGNDKSLGELELFVPMTQNPERLFFLDLRFQLDDNSSEEGNFGLGYRKIIDNTWILGSYAFYDRRRSSNNNDFNQVTVGVEALTEDYDARVNIYLAEDNNPLIEQKSVDQLIYSGFHLVHQTGGTSIETREKAMSGFDVEFGWLLPWFTKQEIRGYVGGYHFSASGIDDISGPRGRLELRFPDIFGWAGSLFEIGGEVRHDNVRDTDYFVSARGRVPFGTTQKSVGSSQHSLNKRMTERVQRDPDIVTGRQHQEISKPIINTTLTSSGNPITITHIDSQGTNGDGSYEAPFNTLEPASPSTSNIILLSAGSDFSGERITLADDQRLLGETVGHTVSTDQMGLITLPRATSRTERPIIRNVAGTAINLANGSEVSGIDITGVVTAIYGTNVGAVDLNRNRISSSDEGIVIEGLMPGPLATQITENSFNDILLDGIFIDSNASETVSANITGNQMQKIGTLFGAGIVLFNDGLDMRVSIADNLIQNSFDEGILVKNSVSGGTFSAIVTDNQIIGSGWDGVSFINEGDVLNLYLQNNHADGDIDNSGIDLYDYYLENNAGTFNLGATAGHPDIGSTVTDADIDVIWSEENTRADKVTAPESWANGTISIVDKATIPTP